MKMRNDEEVHRDEKYVGDNLDPIKRSLLFTEWKKCFQVSLFASSIRQQKSTLNYANLPTCAELLLLI